MNIIMEVNLEIFGLTFVKKKLPRQDSSPQPPALCPLLYRLSLQHMLDNTPCMANLVYITYLTVA